MPDQRPHSWHLQPDTANLSPDSFTAQKLVTTLNQEMLPHVDSYSNMLHLSISILHRGASSSGPYLYVHPKHMVCATLTTGQDSMAE